MQIYISINAKSNVIPYIGNSPTKLNYPNPFNPSTRISYSLPNSGYVSLKVYDILGREIETIVNEFQKAGTYAAHFDASNLASGIYFYELQVGNEFVETKKMLLMR